MEQDAPSMLDKENIPPDTQVNHHSGKYSLSCLSFTVTYSNQHMRVGMVRKMPWTVVMDCSTKTYIMMMVMESVTDIRKVLRR